MYISIIHFILILLVMSCTVIESEQNSLGKAVERLATTKTDSAKYVESILYYHLENPKDSLRAITMLKDIMGKKFIYIEHKKKEKDSLQIPLYCKDKPRSFYFYFENKQLNAHIFDGKESSRVKINNISIGSLSKNENGTINFCLGYGYHEGNHFYSGCEFSGSLYPRNKALMIWITPMNKYVLDTYISEEQSNSYKTYKVGCE